MSGWPFQLWLSYAVKGLKLSPETFWSMSVIDWLSLSSHDAQRAMPRKKLNILMQTYPDEVKDE
jgi:hypothetical protein